jgi:hypothetical protein
VKPPGCESLSQFSENLMKLIDEGPGIFLVTSPSILL